jgi:hypothetical protein
MSRVVDCAIALTASVLLMAGVTAQAGATAPQSAGVAARSSAAVRRDLSILFAGASRGQSFSVDGVLSDGTVAVAGWHTDAAAGFAVLVYDGDHWRLLAHAAHGPGSDKWTRLEGTPPAPFCFGSADDRYPPPTARSLVDRFSMPEALAQAAFDSYNTQSPMKASQLPIDSRATLVRSNHIDCGAPQPTVHGEAAGYSFWISGTKAWQIGAKPSIAVTLPQTGERNLVVVTINTSRPLETEGLSLDVWFPYVIDARNQYVLTLLSPERHVLSGSAADNWVRFALPNLALAAGESLVLQLTSRPAASE